jgi:putative FmdB family regulatory protein
MALYEYRCPDGHTVEVFHKMDEAPEVRCEVCGERAERVISMPMIHTQYYFSTQVRQSRFPRHRPKQGPEPSG